jgi:hypothetical protein
LIEAAYAAGKMLDNSGWNGLLRDRITPSDIDHPPLGLCFDNNGAILFAEFSISCDSWEQMGRRLNGQRRLYRGVIGHGPHCAAICKHDVTPEMRRPIDTLRDVGRFQVMVWDFEPVLSAIYDGAYWQSFVIKWVNERGGPLSIRRHVLGRSVGLVKPESSSTPPVKGYGGRDESTGDGAGISPTAVHGRTSDGRNAAYDWLGGEGIVGRGEGGAGRLERQGHVAGVAARRRARRHAALRLHEDGAGRVDTLDLFADRPPGG